MIAFAPFMSCREETDLSGMVVDSLEFAAQEGHLAGKFALAGLPRLADVVTNQAGSLACELDGLSSVGEHAPGPGLRLRVGGRLRLRCQRCLEEMDFDCAIDSRLLLVPPDAAWPDDELESGDLDAIPASRELALASLVEDEVLLALPYAPRHPGCQAPRSVPAPGRADRTSPFAVLARLKRDSN